MAAFSVKRRSRYAHSKNFYRDLANFSTAVAHKSKPRRKILFSGEYFDVERLIATRETKDGVSLLFSAEVTLIGADFQLKSRLLALMKIFQELRFVSF